MTLLVRWCKFNLVGAMGMVLQLSVLALLCRVLHDHYMIASALAVELTLLHNFVWHLHYTWRERSHRSDIVTHLLRFHLSNGLISMVGNLAMVRLLVSNAHFPVVIANSIAILCCSMANFCLGNIWVFAVAGPDRSG